MRMFIDTEFEDLRDDAGLISIGLVNEAGDEFYAELTDTWRRDRCSAFVEETVLPLLDASKNRRLSRVQLCVRLFDWLLERSVGQEALTMVADSDWDWHMFVVLFQPMARVLDMWTLDVYLDGKTLRLRFDMPSFEQVEERMALMETVYNGRQHHALVDARALRFALMTMEAIG